MFVESTARTNKLYCSDCDKNIEKGDDVVFELDDHNRMENVYCTRCSVHYQRELTEDTIHPHDSDALGQW